MKRQPYIIGAMMLLIIALITLPTLQTIPNGSQHYFMIDAGETQIVLNTWGTLHATGYPLYVMGGNILTAMMRAIGISPASAPSLVSFIWGMLALALIYVFLRRITRNDWIAAGMTLVFALTRTLWIHLVIPEIYSFTLVFLMLLVLIATDMHWSGRFAEGSPLRMNRVYQLALIGGFAVAHHRAVAIAAPALIFAAWGELFSNTKPIVIARKAITCAILALIGFIPYIYLPIRANTDAAWVYGDPNTLQGFLDQFLGREASRFIGVPSTLEGLRANFELITNVLITDVGIIGIVLGVIGLLSGMIRIETRRTAITLALIGGAAYVFHVVYYTDVLSALILMITLPLACGWALLAANLTPNPAIRMTPERIPVGNLAFSIRRFRIRRNPGTRVAPVVLVILAAAALYSTNQPFIAALTRDPAGLDAIQTAHNIPADSVLMLPWGVHHFAVGFAKDVTHEIGGFDLVDHNADFSAVEQPIVTFDYTRFGQGREWWLTRIGDQYAPSAVAPHIVQVNTLRENVDPSAIVGDNIGVVDETVMCDDNTIVLHVGWAARDIPPESLRVFVHLLNGENSVIDQADQEAPVYGWLPTNEWHAGEVVRDVYSVQRLNNAARIHYGLYRIIENGFENVIERETAVDCGE